MNNSLTLSSSQQPSSTGQRANLNLKSFEQTSDQPSIAQPLSPTQTSKQSGTAFPKEATGKQKSLKGPPQHIGLSTLEYGITNSNNCLQLFDGPAADPADNYFSELYDSDDKQNSDFTFKSATLVDHFSQAMAQRLEYTVQLPCDLAIEQIELTIANIDLFNKYLKLLRVETSRSDKPVLHLRGGFFDESKKVLELNTCGVTNKVTFVFSYQQEQRPQQPPKRVGSAKPRGLSDKIKNEIIPLLQDNDELDDEVAMISNKNISTEDIKIEVVKSSAKSAKPEEPEEGLAQAECEVFFDQEGGNEHLRLLQKSIGEIRITGFNLNRIPAITSTMTFMNNSFLLKNKGHLSEGQDCDFMIGVLLITSKRTIQAVEVFRKIQAVHLQAIEAKLKEQASSKNAPGSKTETNKLFVKCAILELLTAESMNLAPQINEKLFCMKRMCELFQGRVVPPQVYTPQIHFMEDPYTSILRLLPVLLKFVLMCVTHKKEIVRLSSMKILEFILETKGCSLDSSMVFILKAILTTYPVQPAQQAGKEEEQKALSDSFSLGILSKSVHEYFQYHKKSQQDLKGIDSMTEYKSLNEPVSGFQNAIKNVYNHVLDTYISVLSSISSHILHQLFYEVIVPTLTSTAAKPEVKVFAIKIAEKIITICQGDLVLNNSQLEYFLVSVSQKTSGTSAEQQTFITNLRQLWGSIRNKVFANYSQKGLKMLIDWLVDKMSMIAQSAGVNNKDMVIGLGAQGGSGMNDDQVDESCNDISKLEVTEEESNQLQQIFDIISVVAVSRKKNEEEANSQIKIKQDYILELYLLINPLLFWLDFSVERESRFALFKSVYQTIKDVLEGLPPKRVDIDLLQIMIPILQKTTDYLKSNSPSLSMLKFLDMVLRDIKQAGYCHVQSDLQYFFLEMLRNFVPYISYCLYEEVFSVFDKLMVMCADVINERVLTKCILALVDKYTMKSKGHKNSLSQFMKILMEVKLKGRQERRGYSNNNHLEDEDDFDEDQISVHSRNNYFEVMCSFCFYYNEDPQTKQRKIQSTGDSFRSPTDLHELYVDKLQFFIESLQLLTEMHINVFCNMITNPRFKTTVLGLLQKGELQLRLKCHEILEIVTNYHQQYCISKTVVDVGQLRTQSADLLQPVKKKQEIMQVEFINQERLYLSQIVVQAVKISLEQKNDSYLQFNSLILLDFLFQNLLPVPSFQNEQSKELLQSGHQVSGKSNNQNQSINGHRTGGTQDQNTVLDIETMDITESTPEVSLFRFNYQFDVTSRQYLLMRLNLIFKLWPFIQQALNSAWSNIRSICYGLICSMLKIDVRDFQTQQAQANTVTHQLNQQFLAKLKNIVLPMLMNLLSSKESESKAGGLNILGSFCGLSYDFSGVKISKNFDFFRKNSQFISLSIWQLVFELQDDWDITIKEASVVLIQLCAPRDAVKYFDKVKKEKENLKFTNMLNRYGVGPGGDHSSRLSSSRGGIDAQMQYLNSAAGSLNGDNEDLLSGIPPGAKEKGILSFLSGTADDMSLVLQMEQNQAQNLANPHGGALSQSTEMLEVMVGAKPGNRNERKIGQSASEDMGHKEESKHRKAHQQLMGEFDDALQYQHIMDQDDINGAAGSHFVFFVDKYSDEQIQEIISIFRNDFKPPKNLWIEKNPQSSFNAPDYYAEIYSQAIDQFNMQQMQKQQQQNEQMQIQLSGGSSKSVDSSKGSLVDALEDDLVKRYENEKKEKEKQKQAQSSKEGEDNFMIFERHFEDKKQEGAQELSLEDDKKDELSTSGNQQSNEVCSIDAEPFQFLDSPAVSTNQASSQPSSSQSQNQPEQPKKEVKSGLSLQILDESRPPKSAKGPNKDKNALVIMQQKKDLSSGHIPQLQGRKKTTDELIEEYERKIDKTKSLLEEEKDKLARKAQKKESLPISLEIQSNFTPDFKAAMKQSSQKAFSKPQEESEIVRDSKRSKPQVPPQSHQLQSYLTEFNQNAQKGVDNAKLLKQIKNCFNDSSSYSSGLGVNPALSITTGVQKAKQKLNKSYENLFAASKAKSASDVLTAKAMLAKKNLSNSPRRGSSSGKKSVSSKGGSKKKYLQQQQQHIQDHVGKNKQAMQNMRDMNYFIKNIEKNISDKYSKLSMKDFNSMPTTPTTILKKVEDQMKALAQNKDIKTQMSNTCPNIAQVLGSIDSKTSKSVGPHEAIKGYHPKKGNETHKQILGQTLFPLSHGVHNFQTINNSTLVIGQSHNSLSNFAGSAMSYSSQAGSEKFQFSETQKLDLKDANKNIFNYNIPVRDVITHREFSNENRTQNSLSPFKEENQHYTNLLKQSKHHKKAGKRSRGSTDKYLLGGGANNHLVPTQVSTGPHEPSGSSSYPKLNKSANNIQANASSIVANIKISQPSTSRKKDTANLSLQLINSLAKANNMSPTNKKLLQQMMKHQFVQPPSSAGLPQALSAQNSSITGDLDTKRSAKPLSTSREKEKTPGQRKNDEHEVSPLQDKSNSSADHTVGLKNVIKHR